MTPKSMAGPTLVVAILAGLAPSEYRFAKTHQGPILGYTDDGRPLAVHLAKLDEGGWFAQRYGMMRAGSLEVPAAIAPPFWCSWP